MSVEAVWDGSSPSRADTLVHRAPDPEDWNKIVEQLQDAQGAVLDTGNSTFALSNSWTAKSSYGTPSARKIGDEVQLSGGITAGTKTDGTTLFTLPAGYRPANPRAFPVCPAGSDTIGADGNLGSRVLVAADGTVKIYGATSTVSLDLSTVRFHTGD